MYRLVYCKIIVFERRMRVPKILISNDDGVSAPGLQALVKEFIDQSFCKVFVCGPFGERSAQSNAISGGCFSCYCAKHIFLTF